MDLILSPSAVVLDAILTDGGEVAESIKDAVHRTQLWRFRTGKGKPDANTIALLHRLSEGRVAADGWSDEAATGTDG